MKHKALRYNGPWQVDIIDHEVSDKINHDEVIIDIKATGICGTDIGIISGEYHAKPGVILGHESAGVVVSVGNAVTSVAEGDRVILDPTYFCGYCRMCRTNRQNHCLHKSTTETGVSHDGTFAKFHVAKENCVHKMADSVSFEAASMTEPLSCAITGISQLHHHAALRTVVLGGGPMGLLYCMGLAAKGLSGILIEQSTERALFCEAALPHSWRITNSLDDAKVMFGSSKEKLDIVVDTTGKLSHIAIPLLDRGGQFLAVGLKKFTSEIDMCDIANRSLSVLGSIDSLHNSFSNALHLISSGLVNTQLLISHTIQLDELIPSLSLLGCDVRNKSLGSPGASMKIIVTP